MKKVLAFIMVIMLCTGIYSCHNADTHDNSEEEHATDDMSSFEKYLDLIYEVGNDVYAEEEEFHHTNIILDQVKHSTDDTAPSEKKMEIDGVAVNLSYAETLYYPVGGRKVHAYYKAKDMSDDNKEGPILINPDGSVYAVLYQFTTIDISQTASPEEVLEVLKVELEKWITITDYEHVRIPDSPDDITDRFRSYQFLFYNQVDGYMTDRVTISVFDDGSVGGFWIDDLDVENITLNIDKALEDELLNMKLKDIYTTNATTYISYEEDPRFIPTIVIYNDELYVEYFVSARYTTPTGVEMVSFLNTILIPVRLISHTGSTVME